MSSDRHCVDRLLLPPLSVTVCHCVSLYLIVCHLTVIVLTGCFFLSCLSLCVIVCHCISLYVIWPSLCWQAVSSSPVTVCHCVSLYLIVCHLTVIVLTGCFFFPCLSLCVIVCHCISVYVIWPSLCWQAVSSSPVSQFLSSNSHCVHKLGFFFSFSVSHCVSSDFLWWQWWQGCFLSCLSLCVIWLIVVTRLFPVPSLIVCYLTHCGDKAVSCPVSPCVSSDLWWQGCFLPHLSECVIWLFLCWQTESSQSVTENQGPATKDITAKLPSSPPASSSSLSTAMLPQGSSTLPDLPLQDLDIMAANKQLAEEIRQNDHLISSMLGMPGGEVGVGSPMDPAWMKLPDLQLFPQQPGFGQLMSNTAQPQGVADVSQVKTTPNPSQAHILPSPGQSQVPNQGQGFLNPSQSQGFPNPSQSQGFLNPSQSQGFPNPSQSQGFPNLGQGHVLPNPGQQQFFTSSVQSQLFPVSSVPQGIQAPKTAVDGDLSLSAGSSVQPLPTPGPGLVQQGMPKSFHSPGSGHGVSGLSHVSSSELTIWRPVGSENPGQPVSSQSTTAPRPSAAVGMMQPQGAPRLPSPTSVFRPSHLIDPRHPALGSNFVQVGAPMWAAGAPASQTDPAGSMWQPRAPAANPPVPSQHTWTQLPPSTAAQQQGFQQQVMLQQQQMMMMRPLPSYLLRARLPGQVRPGVPQPTEGWPTNWAAPPGPSQLPPSVPGMASPPQAAPHMLGNPRVLGAPGVGGGGDGGRGVSEPAQDGTGQLLPGMLPGGQETGGQLLPGMMPLLESLKASCVISPPAPSSSASSRPQWPGVTAKTALVLHRLGSFMTCSEFLKFQHQSSTSDVLLINRRGTPLRIHKILRKEEEAGDQKKKWNPTTTKIKSETPCRNTPNWLRA